VMFHLALPGDAVGKSNFSERKRKEEKRNHQNGGKRERRVERVLRGFWFIHSLVEIFDTFVQPLESESGQSICLPEWGTRSERTMYFPMSLGPATPC